MTRDLVKFVFFSRGIGKLDNNNNNNNNNIIIIIIIMLDSLVLFAFGWGQHNCFNLKITFV